MIEVCYCGRTGNIEDREPILSSHGRQSLRCPYCGHLDSLDWLAPDARQRVFQLAARGRVRSSLSMNQHAATERFTAYERTANPMTVRTHQQATTVADGRHADRTYWMFGNKMTILAGHADTDGRYDLIEGRPPAGYQTPLHRHTQYAEQLYVLDGEVTVVTDTQKVVVRAGETTTIPIGVVHAVAASGSSHGLVIASPSGFAGLIEAFGTPATTDTPPEITPADLERFTQLAAAFGDEILGPPGQLPGE